MSLTGKIGKPMITLHGTLDSLLPIKTDSDVYDRLIRQSGRNRLHRYHAIEAGNHVDGLYDFFPDRLRPILPCYRSAFQALEKWVEKDDEDDNAPPRSHVVAKPATGDLVNSCSLGAESGD